MSSPAPAPTSRSILIVGASRGLGYAMAAEFAERGWRLLGTVRAPETPLHGLAAERPDIVEIETLDMTDHDQILAVRDRLSGRQFDIVFINGGIANQAPQATMAEVSTEEFVLVMVTNVLGRQTASNCTPLYTGSTVSLTREQFEHASGPIDWHPEDHPSAPTVVAVSQACQRNILSNRSPPFERETVVPPIRTSPTPRK